MKILPVETRDPISGKIEYKFYFASSPDFFPKLLRVIEDQCWETSYVIKDLIPLELTVGEAVDSHALLNHGKVQKIEFKKGLKIGGFKVYIGITGKYIESAYFHFYAASTSKNAKLIKKAIKEKRTCDLRIFTQGNEYKIYLHE